MSDRAHVIEIDSIVLTGVNPRNPGQLSDLIEAEVRRALGGVEWPAAAGVHDTGTRVAGEVARTVVQSLQGGNDRV
jgi:hypothetical protein